jgi:ABC-type multidrug transport system ATPase subunit
MRSRVLPTLQDHPFSDKAQSHSIEVVGLCRSFGSWPVLWDLDLVHRWGECLVVCGANGSGKTTLLKVLATQARPDSGQVLVGGLDVKTHAIAVRNMLGLVSHNHLLYEDMTAEENLCFYGRMFSISNVKHRVKEVLHRFNLLGQADQKVRSLSNGIQKRLGIARAILHRPRILLLDEPEAGLDSEALDGLGELIREWKDNMGSVIMTTHNLNRGLEWGDRTAVLANGKITLAESGSHPDTR